MSRRRYARSTPDVLARWMLLAPRQARGRGPGRSGRPEDGEAPIRRGFSLSALRGVLPGPRLMGLDLPRSLNVWGRCRGCGRWESVNLLRDLKPGEPVSGTCRACENGE